MRQIKFRAWNGYEMIMPRDKSYYQHYMSFCGCIIQKLSEGMECFGGGDRWRVAGDLSLMQFTGLSDINGVEIYEGDVVSAVLIDKSGTKNKYVGKVFYQEYEFCIETEDHFWPVASWHCVYECEVIGNIYQNPELLK